MFKVVESSSLDPVRFPIKPGVSLSPGNVVSIVDYEEDLVIDICDGSTPLSLPFGLVGNRCFGGSNISFKRKANVFPQRMIVNLNRFDRGYDISIGTSLYCNSQGLLTSKKPFDDALILAKVIDPANGKKSHMQILWL